MDEQKGVEKSHLLPSSTSSVQPGRASRSRSTLGRLVVFAISILATLVGIDNLLRFHQYTCGGNIGGIWDALDQIGIWDYTTTASSSDICPQADVLFPVRNKAVWDAFGSQLDTDDFKDKAIEWLGGAVRVKYVEPNNERFGYL